MKKRRKAKRYPPTRFLDINSRKMFGMGYMEYLESIGVANRNTFYGLLKRRTLSNQLADKISEIFMVETFKWYEGEVIRVKPEKIIKDPELQSENIELTEEDFNFNDLDDII